MPNTIHRNVVRTSEPNSMCVTVYSSWSSTAASMVCSSPADKACTLAWLTDKDASVPVSVEDLIDRQMPDCIGWLTGRIPEGWRCILQSTGTSLAASSSKGSYCGCSIARWDGGSCICCCHFSFSNFSKEAMLELPEGEQTDMSSWGCSWHGINRSLSWGQGPWWCGYVPSCCCIWACRKTGSQSWNERPRSSVITSSSITIQVAVDFEGLDIEYYWLGNDLGAWAGTSGMTQAAVLEAPENFQRALFSHALDD